MTEDARSFVTQALIASGGVMTALCGGCTVWYGFLLLDSFLRGETYLITLVVMGWLLIGWLPTVIGALLLWAGLRRRKQTASTPPPGPSRRA
jgi:hypothetical protein